MIDPIKQTKKYVRDLLGVKECHIVSGRDNQYSDESELLIAVDSLSPAQELSVTKSYNGDDEIQTVNSSMLEQFTINFYGSGSKARENAYLFLTLRSTEAARTLQKNHSISILRISQITNLKQLAGKTYNERYEITVNVGYNITNSIDTLRFDEAQFEFLHYK